MSLINVRRDVSDPFYRYKMERIQTKIEGKGNGIKTVVVNLPSVAQSLARPGAHVIKYFGFELGAQTNIDPKDDRWIINGAHDSQKLQEHLDGFINKFVLCKKCKNPETIVNVKDGRIHLDCKACGELSEVDLRLKLSGFILKNQPKKSKKDKAERKAARKAKQNGTAGENGNGNGSGEDDGSEQGSNGKDDDDAVSDDELQKMQAEAPTIDANAEVKDDDWAVDVSEEAVKARQAKLPGELRQKLTLADEDDEEGGSTVYDDLGNWIAAQAEEKGSVDEIDSINIYLKAKELGIESKHRTVQVLAQTLFDENITTQIPKRQSMLKQCITSDRHEKALLGGTERLLGNLAQKDPGIYTQVTKILQLYYHFDLISEEVVTKWGAKASKRYTDVSVSKKVRKAAAPFLQWLEEAESEEEESDDE